MHKRPDISICLQVLFNLGFRLLFPASDQEGVREQEGYRKPLVRTSAAEEACIAFPVYVPAGQPWVIRCPQRPLPSLQTNYSVTWYINGSGIPIATNTFSRIHQRGDLLWFVPANIEDTGSYLCVINNATKSRKDIEVVKNSDGLCFNEKTTYPQNVELGKNRKLVCPDLEDFEDENTPLDIQWYKACSPGLLKDERYWASGDSLFINTISKNDEGTYICQANYTYMGKQYYVSRAIDLTTFDPPPEVPIEIIYPQNNSIEVELGSSIVISCNASRGFNKDVFLAWDFSGEQPDDFTIKYEKYKSPVLSIFHIAGLELKIKVGRRSVPNQAPNFQGYLIGGLVSTLFVILAALLTYKFFKVDIVLWYRESCHSFLHEGAVATVVDETVKRSRRVIVVLVPGSSSSSLQGAASEHEIAVYSALIRDGIKVILIELEKIKDYSNMPESIKYLKKKHGVLTWQGDFSAKSQMATTRFWKNVRCLCPVMPEVDLIEVKSYAKPKWEKCAHQEENTYLKDVEEGEVLRIDCLSYTMLYHQHTNYTIHWHINGSKTPITKQNSSRIHQQDSVLLFLPVTYHDSGSYECITQ
ncbi:hypothetical protein JD844_032233 [Phrynosoma platyrhinos]|uniref:Ig-like domain-containing protein n=1 Tax=Phrynosoma platyrhinos TaxID=52577 RepID=A0ABQ7T4X3_PHRPL|nr:hypothetical protein JD844_032233 [Phrynosoma platyrhinos]